MYWYVVTEHSQTRELIGEVLSFHPFEKYNAMNPYRIITYMREINETEYKMFQVY